MKSSSLRALAAASLAASLAAAPSFATPPGPVPDATPAFHVAPVELDAPDGADARDPGASARSAPHVQRVPDTSRGLDTRGLTVAALRAHRAAVDAATPGADRLAPLAARPAAAEIVTTTFTPAQIRAAYGLAALPPAGAWLGAAQRAQLGAGQTIYLVDAHDAPAVADELDTFSDAFGLPRCARAAMPARGPLPVASPRDGCTLTRVHASPRGAITAVVPSYDEAWAMEIAIDVQWAHAIAPLARLVLIETPSASVDHLFAGIRLAAWMGPGVVSMSFSAPEGGWMGAKDAAFTAAGMSYLAATGDSGPAVGWPAVSTHVLAVGGTSLGWPGAGPRAERAWSMTGGGVSRFVPTPPWQAGAVPGLGRLAHRAVADVAFNADPMTGQYIARRPHDDPSSMLWMSAGGTSLGTPQWAGLLAVANAQRALAGQGRLGAPHAMLYDGVAAAPGAYAAAFGDVVDGANGACAACLAHAGYDAVTGLGTPNGDALLAALAGTAPGDAPLVRDAAVSIGPGRVLVLPVQASGAHALSYALDAAPAGLWIDAKGWLHWARAAAGRHVVTVRATDTVTGQSGTGRVTVVVAFAGRGSRTQAAVPH
jgi:hypothetical protein